MEKEKKKKLAICIVFVLVAGVFMCFAMQRVLFRYVLPAPYVVDLMIDGCNKKAEGWELEPGIVWETTKREGDCVYYCYKVDEGDVNMDAMEKNLSEIKKNIFFDLLRLKGDEKLGFQRMADAHMQLIYRYEGSITGRTLELTLTPDDLDRIFNR